MSTVVGKAQSTVIPNWDAAGIFGYASADYGSSWATTSAINAALAAACPNPQNGEVVTLWNTNGAGAGRHYVYCNNVWHYVALT